MSTSLNRTPTCAILKTMKPSSSISHSRSDETIEAKARWFRSLSLSERMDMLCAFTDLALSVNPALQESKHAQPVAGRIQVLEAKDIVHPGPDDSQ
jgi:hypothetical protein